jgi:hypothetical protein
MDLASKNVKSGIINMLQECRRKEEHDERNRRQKRPKEPVRWLTLMILAAPEVKTGWRPARQTVRETPSPKQPEQNGLEAWLK